MLTGPGRRHLSPRWSLALGLPLLLGSTPAAAAGSVGALGSFTTWIGLLAALWAVLVPRQGAATAGAAPWIAVAVAVMLVSLWGWRHQRARVGASRRQMLASPSWGLAADVAPRPPAWPAALDREALLDAARSRFLRLQAAWDAADVPTLGQLTTPDMLEQLLPVLRELDGRPNRTDVITLNAELLAVEETSAGYLASVEFSGLIRESEAAGAMPFRELWLLSGGKGGAPGWRLARQQTLF